MEKRKDVHFSPEEQIDFVKLIDALDWTKEVSPVELVKTANKVAGLKGRRKYETNEVSFGLLIKSFETRVSKFTDTRFHGKDRFYTLKKEFTKEQLLHFAKTGEMLEIKKELGRKDCKYYAPHVPEAAYEVSMAESGRKHSTKRREFPDEEAYMKASVVLGVLSIRGGSCLANEFVQAREVFGWKYQRSIHSKLHSIYQETNEICMALFDKDTKVELVKNNKPAIKYAGDLSKLESNANDIQSLIKEEENRKKVIDYLNSLMPKEKPIPEEPKAEEVIEEKTEDVVIVEPKPAKPQRPRVQVFATSPEQGKSEFQEIKPTTPPFESSKVKWYKSLVSGAMAGAKRGTYFSFSDMSATIKKRRYVDISPKEIRDIINEIAHQKRGFFREIDFSGVTIGSEYMCQEFYETYLAEKITESIFIRLHMSEKDVSEMYPNLKIQVASEISANDNIFEIEMNRGEKAERDFAKLLFRMRPGEIVLESMNNWTMRRAKTVMEKLGFV